MNQTWNEVREFIADLWYTGNFWARWAMAIFLIWPILIVLAVLFPVAVAHVVVPIVALLPVAAIAFLLIAVIDPLAIGIIAVFQSGRRALRFVGAVMGIELAFGLYLALIPVGNRRGLVPVMLLAVVALPLLSLVPGSWGRWLRGFAVLVLLFVTILFFFPNIAPAIAKRWRAQEEWVGKDIRHRGIGAILPDLGGGAEAGEWKVVRAVPDQERAVKLPYLHWFDLNPEEPIVVRNENGDEFLWGPDDTISRHAGNCKEGERVEGIREIPKSTLYLRACANKIVRVGITVEPATDAGIQWPPVR